MRTLFISDLHLHQGRPDLTQALLHFLSNQAAGADQLYILGDLFEAWIGDDAIPPDQQPVISALKQLSSAGTKLFFQHGNRDFLIGPAFSELTGINILNETEIVDLPSSKALLMHGDQLCSDDTEYQALRHQLRNPQWQQAFLSKTISERLAVAQQLRSASKEKNAEKSMAIMDVNPTAVSEAMTDAGINLLIHGHTHRPAVHQIKTGRRIVLGDWDKTGWYLECTETGEQLIEFPLV
ncbi:UDP-2,3-diacylglucosamine diphosphatase [Amphritea balenae]|uniref:UDP-2,3-diacylglucosamine hydrolase n=1 Tax=Amphritea balenae TaxID=452629 RepID=A0A3P1SK99_9GAMM|nr:UDP-2,3-diacylglucosamine diphosphatase [Amphritea balenae]RRC96742.1 UDP-2,3-diacylglucosamine diphosphatase [Amphritea balenae]